MSHSELGHNSDVENQRRAVIQQVRLQRRQAHATAAKMRSFKSSPFEQRLKNQASVEARITNLMAAFVVNRSANSIETVPFNPRKAELYARRLETLSEMARERIRKL